MARRSNNLSTVELSKVSKKARSIDYQTSVELFMEDCELRNLRPYTIKYYLNELKSYERYLQEQDINPDPNEVTEEVIKKNVILYMKELELKTLSY